MEKLEYLIRQIKNCDLCNGNGAQYWDNGEDYDFENCVCNPYELILDGNDVLWDNGLLSQDELSIFATGESL